MVDSKNPFIEWDIIHNSMGTFLVNKYDEIGETIIKNNNYEPHLQEIYTLLIQPEHVCVDAGANLGYHTIQFGKLCKKVYAFEPQPIIYNQLCANILFNDLNQIVEPIKKGLGDKKETQQLTSIEKEYRNTGDTICWNWGGRGIDETPINFEKDDQVQLITLDSYNLKQCDFIKMDIQDYEFKALKGSSKLLENHKPFIFLENPINNLPAEKTKKYLIKKGYDFYRITFDDDKNWYHQEDCIAIHPNNINYQNQISIINKYFSQPKFKDKYYLNKEN